jgi:hypothetical protein
MCAWKRRDEGWVTGRKCGNGEMEGLTDLVMHKRVSRILRLTAIKVAVCVILRRILRLEVM